ncbi:hypothetical protein [Pedobacter aquatilis]|uniref:hypothetical protein n=1 Tax=Pedobacter aquatilis TaxID=351343 RepID=UPI0029315A9E|nr:hypothetical protein [Pedobacter aquatilis]
MINYCIVLRSATFLYVLEPFLRRKRLMLPVLFMGDKVAVYIRRKPVLDLLMLMMKGDIDGNGEIITAFQQRREVEHPYRIKSIS